LSESWVGFYLGPGACTALAGIRLAYKSPRAISGALFVSNAPLTSTDSGEPSSGLEPHASPALPPR